jgi:hypothetical protein
MDIFSGIPWIPFCLQNSDLQGSYEKSIFVNMSNFFSSVTSAKENWEFYWIDGIECISYILHV